MEDKSVDWTIVLSAFIASLPATLAALAAFVNSLRTHGIIVEAKEEIAKVALETNSMKDALVESTGKASRLEGVAEGIQQEKDRPK